MIEHQRVAPHIFKLLPMRHIFFDLVIRFITNRKYMYAFLYVLGQIVT